MFYTTKDRMYQAISRGGNSPMVVGLEKILTDVVKSNATNEELRRAFETMTPLVPMTVPASEILSIPDYWIIEVKDGRLCCGKELGFYYFSPRGFIEDQSNIKEAWMTGRGTRTEEGYEKFKRQTADFFNNVSVSTQRYKAQLIRKVDDIQRKLDTMLSV